MPTVKHSRSDVDLSTFDWSRVDATTDAEIDAQIAADQETAPVFEADKLIAAGRAAAPTPAVDVRALRARLGLTQETFAKRYGFSVDAIRQYESARRVPRGPIRTLLAVIAADPDAVARALTQEGGDQPPSA